MSTSKPSTLLEIYQSLYNLYGPQNWWPARTRTEMMIGAVLTQNTAWTNVEKALTNLRKNNALTFSAILGTTDKQLAEWIRPAGYFNQKTVYLKELAETVEASGSIRLFFGIDTVPLRTTLLNVKGIGPETADSILLYAGRRAVFVVDAYTRRLLSAYGYAQQADAPYNAIASFFTAQLPVNTELYNEYHALIVRWGKDNPKHSR